jgi:hypothetical protein
MNLSLELSIRGFCRVRYVTKRQELKQEMESLRPVDYDDLMEAGEFSMTPQVLMEIADMDEAPQIMYHLASNPEVSEKLVKIRTETRRMKMLGGPCS